MRRAVWCAAIPWFALGCAADSDPKPAPEMSIELLAPTQLPQSKYRVAAQITNFDPAAGLHGQFVINNSSSQQVLPISAVPDARIELDSGTLFAMTGYDVSISLSSASGAQHLQARIAVTTGAPDVVMTTSAVGDAGTLKLTGYGIGMPFSLHLGLRATADASETLVSSIGFAKQDEMNASALVPVVLSTDQPPFFTGRVPPARVFLRYGTGSSFTDVPVGTTQLSYRSGKPNPASGVAGSTFELTLFHPARAPDLAGVTVLFDDTPLAPTQVTELGDITAGGFIYLTRSKFTVPANAAPGVHQVTAKTSFDDKFLSNGPDFTVTAPVQ